MPLRAIAFIAATLLMPPRLLPCHLRHYYYFRHAEHFDIYYAADDALIIVFF